MAHHILEILQDFHPPGLPFTLILNGVREVFVTADAKHATFLELVCQGQDILIEKVQLPLIPVFKWIPVTMYHASLGFLGSAATTTASPRPVRNVGFHQQAFAPFAIDLPMLHRMGDITSLHQVLNYNRRLALTIEKLFGSGPGNVGKGALPASVAESF